MDVKIVWLEKQIEKLTKRIEKLENYGKSVYEAIQMFSEDYARENDYKTALYNGILSKLDKYDFVSAKETSKSAVWTIHRTLRTKGIEVYVGFNTETDWRVELFDGTIGTTKDKKNAYKFEFADAVKVRDDLNKRRLGKQYLWVISKVEE